MASRCLLQKLSYTWTLFLALTSCQTAIQIDTTVETFDHVSAQTWILVTSFCGDSRRRCSHGNHSVNFRWQECLLSCAEGLRKTCVAMSLPVCCQLQEVTRRNCGHTKHIMTKKFTQMLSNMYEVCSWLAAYTFFIRNFHVSAICVSSCSYIFGWVSEHIPACQFQENYIIDSLHNLLCMGYMLK
jgi:hypothetical protein